MTLKKRVPGIALASGHSQGGGAGHAGGGGTEKVSSILFLGRSRHFTDGDPEARELRPRSCLVSWPEVKCPVPEQEIPGATLSRGEFTSPT